jgi:hypothetical protein
MSRRLPYVVAAALLVLVVTVVVWRVFRVRPLQSAPAAAPQSLAADAALLASGQGKWQSEVMKITVRDGTVHGEVLGIEFGPSAPGGQSDAPDAQAKLFTSSPTKGIPHIAEASTSFGDGSFRDVRLRETNGVRTITITRAVPANDPRPAKTQRIFDRYQSVSFHYELKNGVLTLKGFPTTNKVAWGVSEFMVPQGEIQFKIVP